MKKTVARGVNEVEIAAVANEGVGNALVATKEGKVEGDVPLAIKLVKFLW